MRTREPVIVVHGGVGGVSEDRRAAARAGCRAAAEAGWRVMAAGGSALDAVESAVRALEDDPEFNAGTGAVLNAEGKVQLDASIMNGADLRAGAVANVTGLRNPVSLARRVLEDGRHLLLVGPGAERFADQAGVPRCPPEALIVEHQHARWRDKHGTVGAVALDAQGHFAAATSTGGRLGALPGRVGDSPLIGCGTYADAHAGASCTGIGEDIIRVVLAKTAVDLIAAGADAQSAAGHAIAGFTRATGSEAGIILIDRQGRVGSAHNGGGMAMAFCGGDGRCEARI